MSEYTVVRFTPTNPEVTEKSLEDFIRNTIEWDAFSISIDYNGVFELTISELDLVASLPILKTVKAFVKSIMLVEYGYF